MAVKIFAGEKRKGHYKHVGLEKIVGKTVEAVGLTTVEGADGHEPCTMLYFTDGTRHGFVHPAEDWGEEG